MDEQQQDQDEGAARLKAARRKMSEAAKVSVRARREYAEACNEYAQVHLEVTGKDYQPNVLRAPEWPQPD